MYVVASFDYSSYLDLAITTLEENGIFKDNILAVPLDKRQEQRKIMDTIHYSDGVSLADLAAALATAFAVFGSSFGFIWTWGPIIWGLIGAAVGAIVGFIIDWLFTRKRARREIKKEKSTEVFLVIQCEGERQAEMAKQTVWDHFALSVAKIGDKNSRTI